MGLRREEDAPVVADSWASAITAFVETLRQRRVLLLHLDRFVDVVPSPNSAVAVFVYLVGSTELTLDLLNSSKRHWISLSRRKNTAPSPSPQIT